jgi:hypothetical protein
MHPRSRPVRGRADRGDAADPLVDPGERDGGVSAHREAADEEAFARVRLLAEPVEHPQRLQGGPLEHRQVPLPVAAEVGHPQDRGAALLVRLDQDHRDPLDDLLPLPHGS